MYCKKCDLQLPDEAVFCPKCGSVVSDEAVFCPKCGLAVSDDAVFCPKCGSAVSDSSENSDTYNISNPSSTRARKKIQVIPIVVAVLIIGFVVLGVWVVIRMSVDSSQFDSYPKMASLFVVQEEEGVLIYGESAQPIEIDGALAYSLMSEDGSKACIATKNNSENSNVDIWYCDGKSAVKVEDGISNIWISPAGNRIAYTVKQGNTEEYDLFIFDCTSGESSNLCSESGSVFKFSPDGKSYAYTADQRLDNYGGYSYILYESINGQSAQDIGKNLEPFGLSNDGIYLYYLDHGKDYTDNDLYVQKDGEDNKLASNVSEVGCLNRDCSQVLYYKNGATYITVNGEDGEKISSTEIRICLPENTQYSNWIRNVASLTDQLYYANSESGYFLTYLDSEYKDTEIEDFSDYPVYSLSSDGKSLALATDNGRIKYYKNYRDLEQDPIEFRTDEEVLDIIISLDKSVIYFEDIENTLWSVRGEADPEDIADDVNGYLHLSADGKGIFCVADWEEASSYGDCDFGGTLYFTSNTKGSKPVDVAEGVYYFDVSKYGVTYMTVTDFDDDQNCYLADIYYSKNGMNANAFEQVSDSIPCGN